MVNLKMCHSMSEITNCFAVTFIKSLQNETNLNCIPINWFRHFSWDNKFQKTFDKCINKWIRTDSRAEKKKNMKIERNDNNRRIQKIIKSDDVMEYANVGHWKRPRLRTMIIQTILTLENQTPPPPLHPQKLNPFTRQWQRIMSHSVSPLLSTI